MNLGELLINLDATHNKPTTTTTATTTTITATKTTLKVKDFISIKDHSNENNNTHHHYNCCYSTERFKLSDLWKPNSSRETYEHVHHMKASTAAVHEYTLSPEPCSFSIPSPKQISFLVQFLNHWRVYRTCGWICHNLPRLWQIHTRIKSKIGVKMATVSQ